jgi:hypothetical protein
MLVSAEPRLPAENRCDTFSSQFGILRLSADVIQSRFEHSINRLSEPFIIHRKLEYLCMIDRIQHVI